MLILTQMHKGTQNSNTRYWTGKHDYTDLSTGSFYRTTIRDDQAGDVILKVHRGSDRQKRGGKD